MNALLEKMKAAGSIKSTTLAESTLFNDKDVVPTDIPIINVAFSGHLDGGITAGLTIAAGPSKHYKSLLGLMCISAYMKKYPEAVCIFYDSEFGISPDYMTQNNIDGERVVHIPIMNIEELKFDIVKRLEQIGRGDKVFIFIDSLGNLASKKEVDDALDEKSVADMSRAKQNKSLFRMVTPHLTTKDIPCFVIQHTYQTMEMYAKQVLAGGCLVAGTKIKMFDGSCRNIEEIQQHDLVQTLNGIKPVTHIWGPDTLEEGEPECFKVTFDDGYSCIVSETHPFLTTTGWKDAKDLKNNEDVVCLIK